VDDRAAFYLEVEARLRALAGSLDVRLPAEAREIIGEYLDHNELGLAFDHLGYIVDELALILDEAQVAEVRALAVLMGLDKTRLSALWPGLSR
jgi:hypothetical protein